MQKFTLEILFKINGIGSASGLLLQDRTIYLIADNAAYLYEYDIESKSLVKNTLFKNDVPENIPKKDKADLEAMTRHGDYFYILGSGSASGRNRMFRYHAPTKEVEIIDLTRLYLAMQNFADIKSDDFNIEGLVYTGEKWYFFQRGNAGTGKNGIFNVSGKDLENNFNLVFNRYDFPPIENVPATFTDAILVEDTFYFLATAEDTSSAYDDGQILGSCIGGINLKTMEVTFTCKISSTHKFEGLALYKNTDQNIEFLLCEDNDSSLLESAIYKLSLTKK